MSAVSILATLQESRVRFPSFCNESRNGIQLTLGKEICGDCFLFQKHRHYQVSIAALFQTASTLSGYLDDDSHYDSAPHIGV
jgi:hypothetical protein